MLNLLDKIIEKTKDDNHLFARYGFKFYRNIENNAENSFEYIKNKPNFKNDVSLNYKFLPEMTKRGIYAI